MSPRMHAILCNIFLVVAFILVTPFFCTAGSNFHLAVGLMVGYFLSWVMVFVFLPVRCDAPGCNGHMRRENSRISFFETFVQYTCKTCGRTSDQVIYFPDISIEVSG